jgi:hypothetical protein
VLDFEPSIFSQEKHLQNSRFPLELKMFAEIPDEHCPPFPCRLAHQDDSS